VTPSQEAAYRRLAGRYAADPVGYARDVLGLVTTPQQEEIARKLLLPPYRVLVPSANAVGKTALTGALVNWHHDNHDPGIVLATSSTFRQVQRQLFKEVRRQRPFQLGLLPRAPFLFHREDHFVQGFSTNKADSFQGSHETSLFLAFDEATGIHSDFWDRAETMFKGLPGHAWLATYNPNDSTTPAYAAEQSGEWHVVRLSALDHPNILAELRGLPPPVPAAIRLKRVATRIKRQCEYLGRDLPPDAEGAFLWPTLEARKWLTEPPHPDIPWGWYLPLDPLFEVQILGRWPSKATYAVWSPAEVDRCFRSVEIEENWPVQVGADMARGGGAKITIAVRKGIALAELKELPSSTKSRPVADELRRICDRWAPPGVDPTDVPVLIDDTGGYGSGVVDYPEGYRFIGIKSSEAAGRPADYPNRRSELWWELKTAADEGGFRIALRHGKELLPTLRGDLLAPRYAPNKKSQRVVESKEAIRERIKRSPDHADAVCLAWYPHF
jgi:hypothetical protein